MCFLSHSACGHLCSVLEHTQVLSRYVKRLHSSLIQARQLPLYAFNIFQGLVASTQSKAHAPRGFAAGSNQLQSLSSFGFTQPLAPRKRRGPLYARSSNTTGTGAKEVPTSQMRTYSDASENKGLQQQSQWQTLGNGMFGDRVTSSPPNRNGFSSNGLQSSVLSGMLGQDGDANSQQTQLQAFANGLPANGSLFAHSGS